MSLSLDKKDKEAEQSPAEQAALAEAMAKEFAKKKKNRNMGYLIIILLIAGVIAFFFHKAYIEGERMRLAKEDQMREQAKKDNEEKKKQAEINKKKQAEINKKKAAKKRKLDAEKRRKAAKKKKLDAEKRRKATEEKRNALKKKLLANLKAEREREMAKSDLKTEISKSDKLRENSLFTIKTKNKTYKKAKITNMNPRGIDIAYDGGVKFLKYKELSKKFKKKIGYYAIRKLKKLEKQDQERLKSEAAAKKAKAKAKAKAKSTPKKQPAKKTEKVPAPNSTPAKSAK